MARVQPRVQGIDSRAFTHTVHTCHHDQQGLICLIQTFVLLGQQGFTQDFNLRLGQVITQAGIAFGKL